VGSYRIVTEGLGTFNLTAGANFNSTEVTKIPVNTVLPTLPVFARVNELTFEEGTPKDKFTGSVDWSLGPFGATVRATRYGEVLSPQTSAALDLVLEPKTLVDLEGRWNVTDTVRVALGADNVFDEYPTKNPTTLNTTSNTPFSNYSPFGRSGRYVYARVGVTW
jgi:iron complex outermembrane receptor protein